MVLEFSQINDCLYIGNTPQTSDYEILDRMRVGLVINMRFERRPHPNPGYPNIDHLWLPTFDSPLMPIPISSLMRGVRASKELFVLGRRVYVHCAAGVHRGVAMGAAILISLGHSAGEAMQVIKEHRNHADPDIWYIRRRIEQFEKIWKRKGK